MTKSEIKKFEKQEQKIHQLEREKAIAALKYATAIKTLKQQNRNQKNKIKRDAEKINGLKKAEHILKKNFCKKPVIIPKQYIPS